MPVGWCGTTVIGSNHREVSARTPSAEVPRCVRLSPRFAQDDKLKVFFFIRLLAFITPACGGNEKLRAGSRLGVEDPGLDQPSGY